MLTAKRKVKIASATLGCVPVFVRVEDVVCDSTPPSRGYSPPPRPQFCSFCILPSVSTLNTSTEVYSNTDRLEKNF